ncbi:ATP-binding protein [Actinoplanes sp. NPDC049265]|uniref:ATP-binding protein n=1 Tax=Actinoplanes sp. NPDC049265 TaxID=3363902 RepID=UPI0037131859
MAADHGADRADGPGFGAMLGGHRRQARLTQDELAQRAGIGVRTVRDLERGRASRPQRTTVELLANALNLTGADRHAFLLAARGQAAETGNGRRYVRLPPSAELIGRDTDAAELAGLLTGPIRHPRVVTLVGLAGVGKTALALSVCHRVVDAHPGGVAGIVITDGFATGDILGTVAAVFGVGRFEDLTARFAGTSGALLIDAVERSPEAVAEALSRLLERVPTLRFIATGRHPIGLSAERVWPLAPLNAPPESARTLAEVGDFPAVQLFLDRLMRVRREPVAPDEVQPLATLVRRLGGLPMAIELAAAHGRVLTVAEILHRYGDRLLDLTGRPGDATVSLREAVAASYNLLAPEEQYALRRLGMFRHRWSVSLAEQMIEPGRAGDTDVVHLLDRLLELGLLSVRGSGVFRFRLLDVVRDYAAERAAAEGELPASRQRHAEVIAGLAEGIAPQLVGPHLADAANRLDDVAGDVGAALAYAASEDPRTALRLAAALPRWWRFRGRDVTGRQWLRRLLDDPRTADGDPAVRAWAKIGLAQLAPPAPQHGSSGSAPGFSSGSAPGSAPGFLAGSAPGFLAGSASSSSAGSASSSSAGSAPSSSAGSAPSSSAGFPSGVFGGSPAGPTDEIVSAAEALADFERLGLIEGQLSAHTQLAALSMARDDYDRSRRHGLAALELARATGRIRDQAVAENNLTWHEIRSGNLAAARDRLLAVDRLAERCGEHRLRALARANLAEVARLDRRFTEAEMLGRQAVAELEGLGDPIHRRRVIGRIGLALAEAGRVEDASAMLAELSPPLSLPASAMVSSPPALSAAPISPAPVLSPPYMDGEVALVEAAIARVTGDPERAAEYYARAVDAYLGGPDPRDVFEALIGLAATTPDPERRALALARLADLGSITMLPHERKMLGLPT